MGITTALAFTKTSGGQTVTATLTPLGSTELEFRLSVNGVEVPEDTDVAEFDTEADRDAALAETAALYKSNGYVRAA
jgi:hypothetical protein